MGDKQNGITLIALIITIVVMLLLVAVNVNILLNSELIGQAEIVKEIYKNAQKNEEVSLEDYANIINQTVEENNVKLSKQVENMIKNQNISIELKDILVSKIMDDKIFNNEDAVKYILNDKESLDIIKENNEILNVFIEKSKLTKEEIEKINIEKFEDKNKINKLLDYGQIYEIGIDEFISSNTLLGKIINNSEIVDYFLFQDESIYLKILDTENAIKILENSNITMSKIVANKELLERYNESDNKSAYLEQFTGEYTGNVQVFVAKKTGKYLIQCWGARGGTSRINGSVGYGYGKGGYASGEIDLKENDILYVCVGGHGGDAVVGKDSDGGWNGGGSGSWDHSDDETSGGGGGATDVRLNIGNETDQKSLASRIMVAGGGGGASWTYSGGAGGGIVGLTNYSISAPGTQTTGYLFGIGKCGNGAADSDGVAGGGAGYYGGNTSNVPCQSSGAGGSGYISGHEQCIAIKSETDITPKENTYTTIEDSYHYSGKIFTNTVLLNGNDTQPTFDNLSTMIGNADNGHCLITLLDFQ